MPRICEPSTSFNRLESVLPAGQDTPADMCLYRPMYFLDKKLSADLFFSCSFSFVFSLSHSGECIIVYLLENTRGWLHQVP
jgi:hypothetical protein